MADELEDRLPVTPEGFVTEIDPIIPSRSSLDVPNTAHDSITQTPADGVDQTPLDIIEQTPVDPMDETPPDVLGQTPSQDSNRTGPELRSAAANAELDRTPSELEFEETIKEETVKEEPLFEVGEPVGRVGGMTDRAAEPPDTDEDLPFSRGPEEAEIDITAPTVTGGESHLDTPLGIQIHDDAVSAERAEDRLERTEIVGRAGGLRLPTDGSLGDTVVTKSSRGGLGWFFAFAILVVAAVAVAGLLVGVVRPLQRENQVLRDEVYDTLARELETRSRLETLSANNSQLEAATESLNRQVEEQEGERDASLRREEEEDAARRRQADNKAGDKKKAKKKRKKRRR